MSAAQKPTTEKVSVSIDRTQLRWAKALSKQQGVSVSSVLSEALSVYHYEKERELAAREVVARYGADERATPAEAKALLAKWRG